MDDLLQHISTLEEEAKQKLGVERNSKPWAFDTTTQHSSTKEQHRNLTDVGIVQTRCTDFGNVTEHKVQTQLERSDDDLTLF